MRKVDDGEKRKKKRKKKRKENNDVYSGHYVIASRPPERRPTGTPHARANLKFGTNADRCRKIKNQVQQKDLQNLVPIMLNGDPLPWVNQINIQYFEKRGDIYWESELLTPGVQLHVTTYPNPGY